MKITLLGTGTSTGIPIIGCDCEVCTSQNPRNKRLRTSALIQEGGKNILIDCSTDFRQQALTYHIDRIDAVLITHAHADHVAGIDELRIFNFIQGGPIQIFAAQDVLDDIKMRFHYCFDPPQIGGGVPQLELVPVDRPFELFGITIIPLPVMHGEIPILGFRFNDFTYITDASSISEETFKKVEGTRIFVLNALRYKPHATHFSLSEALETSRRIKPDKTFFTHIAHKMEHEAANRQLPPDARLAYDGQVIEL